MVVHPASPVVAPISAIGLPGGDDETVQHGGFGYILVGHHVKAVGSGDMGRVRDDAMWVGEVILVNIAAQHGEMCFPIALLAGGLRPGKAAVEGHAARQSEGIADHTSGVMHAGLHPDLITAGCSGQRGLQAAGVSPTGAVAVALHGGRGVEHARVRAHGTGGDQGECGYEG